MLIEPLTAAEKRRGLLWLPISFFLLPTLISAGIPMILPDADAAQLNFIYYLVNFLAVAVIFRRFWQQALHTAGSHFLKILHGAIFGFLGYWTMNSVLSSLIIWLMPEFFNVNDSAISQTFTQNFLLMAIGTAILVPVAEECLYRGLVFGLLARKHPGIAYAVSILVFAAIHVVGYIGTYPPRMLLLCLLQYFPAGFCLAWSYRKSGHILAPILIHATINTIGILSLR